MAVILDDTISGEQSNSYCDVTYGDEYYENHYSTIKANLWDALEDDQKAQLLVQACRIIESIRFTEPFSLQFGGDRDWRWNRNTGTILLMTTSINPLKYVESQALQFPRNLDVLQDATKFIPEEVKMAQCEQAIYIITFDETAYANILQGVKRDTITIRSGDIILSQGYAGKPNMISPVAAEFLKQYMLRSGAKMSRG